MPLILLSITTAPATDKAKYIAKFERDGRTITTKFGAAAYKDYTIYYRTEGKSAADKRRAAYIARHSATEDFTDPTKAGTLSRYILWEKSTVTAAITAYRRRFDL
jgi:hypothetical protein